jgi:hypothetical protein
MYAIVTAKMPGVARPCTKRQKIRTWRPDEVADIRVAMPMRAAEATMTRLRPRRSAIWPTKGAARATAAVAAVTVSTTWLCEARKTFSSSGKTGCVA